MTGKIASILELGSGFHPEFTGRQNIVLNAAMLGLSEEELRRKMPDIVAFSELGEFIDQPVKCYSTGMAMRLGFSIATQVEPDVLIVDEALSVGDGYFQKKCMDRLRAVRRRAAGRCSSARTPCTTSRPSASARSGCARGGPRRSARSPRWCGEYENFLVAKSAHAAERRRPLAAGPGAREPAGAAGAYRLGAAGSEPEASTPGRPLELEVEWEAEDPRLAFHLGVGINRADGIEVCSFATHLDGLPPGAGSGLRRAPGDPPPAAGEGGVHPVYFPSGRRGAAHLRSADHSRAPSTSAAPSTPSAWSRSSTPGTWTPGAAHPYNGQPVAPRLTDPDRERKTTIQNDDMKTASLLPILAEPSPRPCGPRSSRSTRSSTSGPTGSTTR